MGRDRLIRLPAGINKRVAAFTELVSVSFHTIDRFDKKAHARREKIGVWGDGNLAFITSLLLKKRFPQSEICIFGKNDPAPAENNQQNQTPTNGQNWGNGGGNQQTSPQPNYDSVDRKSVV